MCRNDGVASTSQHAIERRKNLYLRLDECGKNFCVAIAILLHLTHWWRWTIASRMGKIVLIRSGDVHSCNAIRSRCIRPFGERTADDWMRRIRHRSGILFVERCKSLVSVCQRTMQRWPKTTIFIASILGINHIWRGNLYLLGKFICGFYLQEK